MTTISFEWWGNGAGFAVPDQADTDAGERPIEAVCRAIEAANPWLDVADCHVAIHRAREGKVEATHYELTLAVPLATGGYSPRGTLWVSVPVGTCPAS